jgi:hypothetical protein
LENDGFANDDTFATQKTPESGVELEKPMRFPKRIKYRGQTLAVIYGRCKGRESYRVVWHVPTVLPQAAF